MIEFASSSAEETERLGARLASVLEPGDVVAVSGELGAGKTTLVRGACRALGVDAPVTSPTFAIGNRYRGRVEVSHLDLYRFERFGSNEWADLERYFDDAVVFVEWPENAAGELPVSQLEVRLRHLGGDRRLICVSSAEKPLESLATGRC